MFGNSLLRERASVGWTSCPSVKSRIVEFEMFPSYVFLCLIRHVIDPEIKSLTQSRRERGVFLCGLRGRCVNSSRVLAHVGLCFDPRLFRNLARMFGNSMLRVRDQKSGIGNES